MKIRSLLTCSLAVFCLALSTVKAEKEKPLKEKVSDAAETVKEKTSKATETVVEKTKEAWKKTKAYLSEDGKTYRDGASEKLKEIDVTGVEAAAHGVPIFNVFREDEPCDCFTAEEALSNAPRQANNLFIVPKVVE